MFIDDHSMARIKILLIVLKLPLGRLKDPLILS